MAVLGLAFYAVYFQAASGGLDALLADALPPGPKRTSAYAMARSLQTASRALGPVLQVAVGLKSFTKKATIRKLSEKFKRPLFHLALGQKYWVPQSKRKNVPKNLWSGLLLLTVIWKPGSFQTGHFHLFGAAAKPPPRGKRFAGDVEAMVIFILPKDLDKLLMAGWEMGTGGVVSSVFLFLRNGSYLCYWCKTLEVKNPCQI